MSDTIRTPPPEPDANVAAALLDDLAQDISDELQTIEDSVAALRQLAQTAQREADRARAGKAL